MEDRIVHSLIDEELPEFATDGCRSFAVRLIFSTAASTAAADAKEAFLRFLNDAASWTEVADTDRVQVYRLSGTVVAPVPAANVSVQMAAADAVFCGAFRSWFEGRVEALPEGYRAWPTHVMAPEKTEAELSAHEVLAGVTTWPAPAPHRLGLAFRVDVRGLGSGDAVLVVPRLAGATTEGAKPDASKVNDEHAVDIGYKSDPAVPYTVCRAGVSHAPDTRSTLVGGDGFIPTQSGDDEFGRAVRRVEQRAGSLFTRYFAATEIGWDETIQAAGEKAWLVCLAWQATTAMAASLDTTVLALLMPGRDLTRDGQVLGPFLALLIRRRLADGPVASARATLRQAVRDGLKDLVGRCSGPQGIGTLEHLCSLEDAAFTRALVEFGATASPDAFNTLETAAKTVAAASGSAISLELLRTQLDHELATPGRSVLGEGMGRVVAAMLGDSAVAAKAAPGRRDDYLNAVDELRGLFEQGLDCGGAARHSVGSLVADLAAAAVKANTAPPPTADALKQALGARPFWPPARIDESAPAPGPAPLLDGLVEPTRPLSSLLKAAGLDGQPALAKAIADAVADADAYQTERCLAELFPGEAARFVPDHTPQPLLVPIAVDPHVDDDASPDSFSTAFAGLAVLVRNGTTADWAYACLAELVPAATQGTPPWTLPPTIAPLPTAIVDGRRELLLSYAGHPFASAAYADGTALVDRDAAADPFFTLDYPDTDPATQLVTGSFTRLPPLAYGTACQVAVHAVGRAGSLPGVLQDGLPWQPRKLVPATATLPVTMDVPVSRRTAIGRTVFADKRGQAPARIGLRPDGLRPLSLDQRRVAVAPGAAVDLLRGSDGAGLIRIATATAELTLRDVQCWGDAGNSATVEVTVWSRADAAPATGMAAGATLVLSAGQVGDIRFGFSVAGGQITTEVRVGAAPPVAGIPPVDAADVRSLWVRLSVKAGPAISFADPALDRDAPPPVGRGEPDGLLLLGAPPASAGRIWRAPFDQAAKVEIVLPRTGLADFLRWTSNPALRDAALDLARPTDPRSSVRIARFHLFRLLLVALDIGRLTDPGAAERLDRLPDLAVNGITVTASPLDSLAHPPGRMAIEGGVRSATAGITMPSLWSLIGDDASRDDLAGSRIVTLLDRMDASLRRDLQIEAGDAGPGRSVAFDKQSDPAVLTVGGGLSVRVSARPEVKAEYFGPGASSPAPAIDARMMQYAVGHTGGLYTFDGAHLVVETMIGPLARAEGQVGPDWLATRSEWASDRAAVVKHVPATSSRHYQVALRGSVAPPLPSWWRWRQLGAITTWTQAWRFGGRPIRSWIRPRDYASSLPPGQPSFAVKPDAEGAFRRFEDEAFRRADDDAQPHTAVLGPLDHDTLLTEVMPDDRKGATIYRHAFTLVSRYAAAMRDPDQFGRCDAWPSGDRWLRVVVLGLREPVLTRPQLRALIPLTRRTEADLMDFAPPVLAILQEEPFAFGGLAARVASEIRTGVGYAAGTGGTVAPDNLRKEVGPDGRLLPFALDQAFAQEAVLSAEGPIGLTFDRDGSAAPAFANTALLLHPTTMTATPDRQGVSEESFISVGLRRFLDPDWLVDEDTPGQAVEGGRLLSVDEGALWIDVPGDMALSLQEGATPLVSVSNAGVGLDACLLDGSVSDCLLYLCGRPAGLMSLLLAPQGKGRFTLAVFAASSVRGDGAVVLASAECQLAEGTTVRATGAGLVVRRTTASAATGMNWVRTNPDFDRVVTVRDGVATTRPVTELRAVRTGGSVGFRIADGDVWVRAEQSTRTVPSHSQRHIVCLFSSMLAGPGPEIEQLLGATLMPGSVVPSWAGADAVRLMEIETPAQIAASPPASVPPPYGGGAYFDLAAIGTHRPPRALFRLRRAGPLPAFPDGPLSLNVRLQPAGDKTDARNLTVWTATPGPAAIELLLEVRFEEKQDHVGWQLGAVDRAGTVSTIGGNKPCGQEKWPNPVDGLDAITVSITEPGAGETWLEVSLLTTTAPRPVDFGSETFDFDWLFGARTGDGGRIDDPALLAALAEAQARCVRVSPRIVLSEGHTSPEM